MAHGLDFLEIVGPGQQVAAAGKQLALKVGAQTVGQHRNVESIAYLAELKYLILGQKLRLIDQHAVDGLLQGFLAYVGQKVFILAHADGFSLNANSRLHEPFAKASIDGRREDQRVHAALAIVVIGLEQRRGFSGVHCRVIEVEFGHRATLSEAANSWDWRGTFRA